MGKEFSLELFLASYTCTQNIFENSYFWSITFRTKIQDVTLYFREVADGRTTSEIGHLIHF
jgi:hypothetical protein